MDGSQTHAEVDTLLQVSIMYRILGLVVDIWYKLPGWTADVELVAEASGVRREHIDIDGHTLWGERVVIVEVVQLGWVGQVHLEDVPGVSLMVDRHDVQGIDLILVEPAKVGDG